MALPVPSSGGVAAVTPTAGAFDRSDGPLGSMDDRRVAAVVACGVPLNERVPS